MEVRQETSAGCNSCKKREEYLPLLFIHPPLFNDNLGHKNLVLRCEAISPLPPKKYFSQNFLVFCHIYCIRKRKKERGKESRQKYWDIRTPTVALVSQSEAILFSFPPSPPFFLTIELARDRRKRKRENRENTSWIFVIGRSIVGRVRCSLD